MTQLAILAFKFIAFPLMWVSPAIVDMMARSIVQRRGESDYWYNANDNLYAEYAGEYTRVAVRVRMGQWIEVRRSASDYFNRGFWLLKLWWAL